MSELVILNVSSKHFDFANGDKPFLTKYGEPYHLNLFSENMYTDENWFKQNLVRLIGKAVCIM